MEQTNELKHIRFKQRLSNFDKAYAKFEEVLKRDTEHDEVSRMALLQAFEFTFELAWKVMQDLLEAQKGIIANSPREALQEAYQQKYISDNGLWAEALKKRNESSHAYAESIAVSVEKFIRSSFAPILAEFYNFAKKQS
jgi:nucleotidyltransferase substrate binding protein (TIGR01987 family)